MRGLMAILVIVLMSSQVFGQGGNVTVSGKVTSTLDGEPLPGVNVRVKNTSTGTVTDFDGVYRLQGLTPSSVLVFSFIGYNSEEVTVGNQTTINVSLAEDIESLSEVVVVGYGTQREESVTGSVASIGGEAIREVPAANISQALQGRLPGVEFAQTSSQPGAATQIRIRGARSLTAGNDPLVVLDGIPFPGSISEINPNDIKSIDILKDASATAIYGSRGANGVILVTTKGGQIGQKPVVSYNSFYGTKEVFAKYPMMSGPEFVKLRQEAGIYNNALDESDDVNTDWQDLLYRNGMITSHDLGVSGGTEKGRYNFNIGYFEDEGVIPTQQYTRYSIRGSLDQGVGEYFRFGFSTYNNFSITEGSNVGLYGILSMSPIASPYNEDGTWKRTIRMPLDETWVYSRDIVNRLSDEWLSQTKTFGTYNTLYGEVKIPGVEGLKYRVNLGLNYRQSNGGGFTGQGINSANPLTQSIATVSNQLTTDWTIENLVTYDRLFGQKHLVNVVALYSASENQMNRSRIEGRDIPTSDFQFYNLGNAAGDIIIRPDDQWYNRSGLMSYMGRVMYAYDDRYMISATLRSDGSSRLAPGYKWHTYPAVSAGWNISEESFMENINLFDMMKLRVGYGQTSNQAVDPYQTLGLLSTRPYNFGPDDYQTGFYVSQLANPNLGWEFSKTWNYGLDFSLLNHRLKGTVEYYITNTEDLLLSVGLPATSGVGSVVQNVGETQNKGVELSLNGLILDDVNGWTLEAGLNFYANRNELIALSSGEDRNVNNWWFVGHPINVIYDYEKIGLWQEGDPYREILEPGEADQIIGSIKVRYTGEYDAEGKPVRAIGPDDRQIMNVNPDFQGGFNMRLGYKGFDLTTVGAFQRGGILISTLYSASGYLNMLSGRRNNVSVDYWTPENTDADFPRPGRNISGDNPKYGNTLGYFDASYLKIRTISLGYNFNESNWLKKAGVGNLRLYVTAQNPFVMFSPYKDVSGMDPETNSFGDENAAVTTAYQRRLLTLGTNAPATRNYLVGLNVTF
jgi:TonB-linked SusC/RagA family outer membrane protein